MAGTAASGTTVQTTAGINGGRFDFDDGGTYCGGWEEGKAHGHGVCTGPKGQGEYAGSWHYGFEVSGVYTWPSGSFYEGHWQNGKRHGLGVESRGKWFYRGEWTQGFKGRYGVRQSTTTLAKYEGTWANGLQDGYGSETYADGGTYQGQWLRGMRHGYGVRTSAAFGIASHSRAGGGGGSDAGGRRPSLSSLQPAGGDVGDGKAVMTNGGSSTSAGSVVRAASGGGGSGGGEDPRGGFVLKSKSDEVPPRRQSLVERTGMKNLMKGLRRKGGSTGDLDRKGVVGSIRSTGSTTSWMSSDSNYAGGASIMSEGSQASFIVEDDMLDPNVTETYMGEWKNDKRCGFGISERSDGLKYEGEWFNNRKYGYGVTTFKDGSREEGKYKNNILITSNKKKHLFLIRSAKFRERIDSAVSAAQRASKIALQKADIAISRTATARGKGEQADYAAVCARDDSSEARACAKTLAPEFGQPGYTANALDSERDGAAGTAASSHPHPHPPNPQQPAAYAHNAAAAGQTDKQPQQSNLGGGGGYGSKAGPGGASNILANNSTGAGQMSPHGLGPGPPAPGGGGPPGPGGGGPTAAGLQQSQKKTILNHIGDQNVINNSSVPNPLLDRRNAQPPAPPGPQNQQLQPPPSTAARAPPSNQMIGQQQPQQQTIHNSRQPPPALPSNQPTTMQSQQQPNRPAIPSKSDIAPSRVSAPAIPTPAPQTNSGPAPPIISAPPPRLHPEQPAYPEPAVFRQPNTLQISEQVNRGRTPTRQDRARMNSNAGSGSANGMEAGGGGSQITFNKIMDDRFEHYKRPPSRERSTDRFGLGSRAGSRQQLSRDTSRDRVNRPMSRQRTPMSHELSFSENKPSSAGLDSLNLDAIRTGNGVAAGSGADAAACGPLADLKLPAEDQMRFRGVQQEIPHFGAPPKRTESLYMKPGDNQQATYKVLGGSAMQRKKSLPDVAALPTVSAKQGTQVMTREEISVLSSARREQIRRDLEEAEKYRANPILYIFNPQLRDWLSRQQLMVVVLLVNVTLAIMFFKLLT